MNPPVGPCVFQTINDDGRSRTTCGIVTAHQHVITGQFLCYEHGGRLRRLDEETTTTKEEEIN